MLIGILKEEKIPYSALPYGEGVESRLGLPLSNYRLFVPFGWLEAARNAVREAERAETENLRSYLTDNKDKLNISPRAEKRYRRKNKLPKETDFCGYCLNIIKSADKIVDNGLLRGADCGHFLYCVSDRAAVAVNSETFEILSFKLI